MPIADSNRGRLALIAESVFGTLPATPTLQEIRMTSSDFTANKETTQSSEIRSDRMVAGLPEVGFQSGGSINFELSLGGTFDSLLEAALCGTISTGVLKNGVVPRSFSIEQGFVDIDQYQMFRGQRIGNMNLSIRAGSIITGSFGFQGTEVTLAQTEYGTAYTPVTTTDVVNATSNVGTIQKDGGSLATALQGIDLSIENGLRPQKAIGSRFPVGIGMGRQVITGSVMAYFEDETLYQAMLDHDDVSLSWTTSDAAGNSIVWFLPRVKLSSSDPKPGGLDQDVMETLQFTALPDSGTGTYQIQLTITNV